MVSRPGNAVYIYRIEDERKALLAALTHILDCRLESNCAECLRARELHAKLMADVILGA
jgi:hypothetical protein